VESWRSTQTGLGLWTKNVCLLNSRNFQLKMTSTVYAMAHVSKATIPHDIGGPSGKRISLTVGGNSNWALRASAFVTARLNSADWPRYSLVVLNCKSSNRMLLAHDDSGSAGHDNSGGTWDPQPVKSTISFRGLQVCWNGQFNLPSILIFFSGHLYFPSRCDHSLVVQSVDLLHFILIIL
jgi:hypothetical protein